MITAVLIIDNENHYDFPLTDEMKDHSQNHCVMISGLSEIGVVVSSKKYWHEIYPYFPPSTDSVVMLAPSSKTVDLLNSVPIDCHKLLLGNQLIYDHYKLVDILIAVRYKVTVPADQLTTDARFEFPPISYITKHMLGETSAYTIEEYILK